MDLPNHTTVCGCVHVRDFFYIGLSYILITGSFNKNLPEYSIGYVNIIIVFLVSITSIFTANIGAYTASKINKIVLRRFFSIFLLFTCISLIIEHFIL